MLTSILYPKILIKKSTLFLLVASLMFSAPVLAEATDKASVSTSSRCLLKAPPSLTEAEIQERLSLMLAPSGAFEMCWTNADRKFSLGFDYQHRVLGMQIHIEGELPEELSAVKHLFAYFKDDGKEIWLYTYGGHSPADLPQQVSAVLAPLEEAMGIVHKPRQLKDQHPRIEKLPDLAISLQGKRCVFYTGAGISADVVSTMPQLMKSLQLPDGPKAEGNFITTIRCALENPDTYAAPMKHFYEACLCGVPTPAHLAVRDISRKKNWGVLTENLDLLHQRSGIDPLSHNGRDWLRSNVTPADLKQIDAVITVGLASDESGFLGWYKAIHPEGRIIAINLAQPNYLGDEDVFVQGDAQELLPQLRDMLMQ